MITNGFRKYQTSNELINLYSINSSGSAQNISPLVMVNIDVLENFVFALLPLIFHLSLHAVVMVNIDVLENFVFALLLLKFHLSLYAVN